MSAAQAIITPPEFTVDLVGSLQSQWGIPNLAQIPATPHEFILPFIWASADTSDDAELYGRHLEPEDDEAENYIRQYPIVAVNETSNPGPWLSESIIDCLLSPEREELTDAEQGQYGRQRIAQESFKGFRHDGLHTISDESGNTFNTARDGLGLTEDKLKYSWQPEPKPKKPAKKIKLKPSDKDKTTKVAAFTPVTDWEMDLAYLQYVSPSTIADPRGKLFEALHGFTKGRFPHAKGIKGLVDAGELEDAVADFTVEIMSTLTTKLERGQLVKGKLVRVLDGPACHYVTKAMSNSRKGAAIDFADYKKTYLADGYESDDSNEEYDASRLDDIVDNGWLQGRFDSSPDSEYEDDVQNEQKVWLWKQIEHGTLPVQLQPIARMYWLQEMTQNEIEIETGITQGAISKQLKKVREYIQMKKAVK